MFDNIGGKIKAWAKVVCWVGIVVSVIAGISVMAAGGLQAQYSYYSSGTSGAGFFVGLLIAALGALASWVGSFILYGFGELIESNKAIENKLTQLSVNASAQQRGATQDSGAGSMPGTWRCRVCGTENPYGTATCKDCGATE